MKNPFQRYALWALSPLFLICAIRNWYTTVLELRRFYTNLPIWDAWDMVPRFDNYRHLDLSVFWLQHNEHRLIGTEALIALDMLLFHGRQWLPTLAGVGMYCAVLFILSAFSIWGAADKRAIGCATLLIFALAGYKICAVSLTIPFLCQWTQWELFSLLAIATAVLHSRRGGRLFLWPCIAFAVLTTYTIASGMFLWPVLLAIGCVLHFRRKDLAQITAVGSISIALYFYHYTKLSSLALGTLVGHPIYAVEFLGSFLGMPFSAAYGFSRPLLSCVCGWLPLAVFACDVYWTIRKRLFRQPAVVVLGGYGVLMLIAALLTAIGRMNPEDPYFQAARAGRYITEPTLWWCAVIMLTVWLLGRAARGLASPALMLSAAAFAWVTLSHTGDYYQQWEQYFQRGQWAEIAVANGVLANEVADVLYSTRDFVWQNEHILPEHRLAVFADPEPWWIGRRATDVFARGADGWIHGKVTTVKPLGKDFEIQGWADGASKLVFTDEAGRIVGFGWRPKAGVVQLWSDEVPRQLAFTGFIRGDFKAKSFSTWAVDRKGRSISRMGELRTGL